MLTYAPPFEVM